MFFFLIFSPCTFSKQSFILHVPFFIPLLSWSTSICISLWLKILNDFGSLCVTLPCVAVLWFTELPLRHWAFRVLRNAQRTGAVLKLSGRGRKFGKENMLDCLWTQDQWSEGMWIFFSLLIYFAFLHLLVIVNIVLYVVNHLYLFSCESLVHAPLAHFSIRFHWFADALCALGILTFVLVNVFHIFSPGLPFVS